MSDDPQQVGAIDLNRPGGSGEPHLPKASGESASPARTESASPARTDLESKIEEAIKNPRNLGEMKDADAIGTVGSPDCGDMLRMWIKFKEEDGRKIIDRATFQSFGCQTAIAVASVATEMLAGKTIAEARALSGEELAAPLGPLPPVKIHCAQLVEGALRSALSADGTIPVTAATKSETAPTLLEQFGPGKQLSGKVKVVLDKKEVA